MPSSGPRKLVFNSINRALNPVTTALDDQGAYTESTPLAIQNLRIHSSSQPQLVEGQRYKITVNHDIAYHDAHNTPFSHSLPEVTKNFQVQGSKWTLDAALVHSVYPPQGHAEPPSVLPHIVFKNPQVPWMIGASSSSDLSSPAPWFGLVVFTEDELKLSDEALASVGTITGNTTLSQNSTLAVPLTIGQLESLGSKNAVSPHYSPDASSNPASQVQVLLVTDDCAHRLFQQYNPPPSRLPLRPVSTPDLSRFNFMSHVRRFNSTGLANWDNDSVETAAVTVSPRAGPWNITKPTPVYVHLVCLSGFDKIYRLDKPGTLNLTALVSLYSWSYICTPPNQGSLTDAFKVLSQNVQPLRNPDQGIKGLLGGRLQPQCKTAPEDSYVQMRMLSGYTLVRYVTQTGEPTVALQRGLLSPVQVADKDLPASNVGSDLANLDLSVGLLDLTYQVAWELGRISALANRDISAALIRLKNKLHSEALRQAKTDVADTYVSKRDALKQTLEPLTKLHVPAAGDKTSLTTQRWIKPVDAISTRAYTSLSHDYVRSKYEEKLDQIMPTMAAAAPESQSADLRSALLQGQADVSTLVIHNEYNKPASSDYASILAWVMDKWFLHGLPMHNIIPDPAFIPKESIRTFFIDKNWFRVFLDGAISSSELPTEQDSVRMALKKSLTKYLNTHISESAFPYYPQVPKWGFFLRSSIVAKFPDLRISAPRDKDDKRAEILRMKPIDQDTLLVLFDRQPGDFPSGITISPPEHQLIFQLGDDSPKTGIAGGLLTMNWRKLYTNPMMIQDSQPPKKDHNIYHATLIAGVFDFYPQTRALVFPHFAIAALKSQTGSNSYFLPSQPTAAIIGAQLIGRVPQLLMSMSNTTLVSPPQDRLSPKDPPKASSVPVPPRPASSVRLATRVSVPSAPDDVSRALKLLASVNILDKASLELFGTSIAPTQRTINGSPLLTASIYTVKSDIGNFRKLFALYPPNMGYTTDLQVNLRNPTTPTSAYATSISVSFTVGTREDQDLLAPFSVSQSGPDPAPSPVQSGGILDFPHSANFSGTKTPKVRFVGIGKRWSASTTYPDPTTGSETYTVKLVPSYTPKNPRSSTYGSVSLNPDLSFVIEDVQLNPPVTKEYSSAIVTITENYTTGSATSVWTFPVYVYTTVF